ncbi:MAG: hypothetical protein RL341_2481 [Pseudomonadota bacterium]
MKSSSFKGVYAVFMGFFKQFCLERRMDIA